MTDRQHPLTPMVLMNADLDMFERNARMSTGDVVHLAPARPGDEPRIVDFYARLGPDATYHRFFGVRRSIPEAEIRALTSSPVSRSVALIASIGAEIVGLGELHANPEGTDAEVAFAVSDEWHHHGIATLLLEDLAVIARHIGVTQLTAMVLPDNDQMKLVFRTAGLEEQHHYEGGVVSFVMSLEHLEGLRQAADRRAEIAAGVGHAFVSPGSDPPQTQLAPLR